MKNSFVFDTAFPTVTVLLGMLCCILAKNCTNKLDTSHSLRFNLSNHLVHTDESAWSDLGLREFGGDKDDLNWMTLYRKMKYPEKAGWSQKFLNEIPLSDVRLDSESIHGQAQLTNLEYLLSLDVDRLVWSFRKTAGLPTPGEAYGGWESPDQQIRGHFVGHYLSATARMWASTGNDTLKEKMDVVVAILFECQDKIGNGYLSAFPSDYFDLLEDLQPIWAPYYTIHKIMAGLVDQYIFAANSQALEMVKQMAYYFYKRVQNVVSKYSVERHWHTLNEESGGMNDVLYMLYTITGDSKHLMLAHLFDKPCFLGILAVQADNLANFHANTHIPVVVGAQMRYEITGDRLYEEISTFFMDIVNSSHSYATGGTSSEEFWGEPRRLASALGKETEESCTTYNMLKVSRNLFRWTKDVAYADYYERALTNGVLSIQRRREPGKMIYMLPLGRGVSKAVSYHGWGTKYHHFWCCYGTGIESFSKLGDSIYFEEGAEGPTGLYIIQYISSSVDWKTGNLVIKQKVNSVSSWDPRLRVMITVSSKEEGGARESTLNLRIPIWADTNGTKASLNGQSLTIPASGNFLSVTNSWSSSDELSLQLPLTLRSEAIKDDRSNCSSIHAFLYGSYLLAGFTYEDWDVKADNLLSLSETITPVPAEYNSHLVSLSQESGQLTFSLSHINNSVIMTKFPDPGANTSVLSTFRLIFSNDDKPESISLNDVIGKSVKLEPFDLPGMVLVPQGKGQSLVIAEAFSHKSYSAFHLKSGLNGKDGTISLESEVEKGCYVYSDVNKISGGVKLSCCSGESDLGFKEATSFGLKDGISSYHPISFVAKGLRRNFILSPLFSMTDEHYTVYFNVTSS